MLSFFTIDLTPVVKGRVCSVHASCHLLENKWLGLLLLACKDLSIPFSLIGTLVFAIMVLPACSIQKLR